MIHASAEREALESVSQFTVALRKREPSPAWDTCGSSLRVPSSSEASYRFQTRLLPFQTSLVILKFTTDCVSALPSSPNQACFGQVSHLPSE